MRAEQKCQYSRTLSRFGAYVAEFCIDTRDPNCIMPASMSNNGKRQPPTLSCAPSSNQEWTISKVGAFLLSALILMTLVPCGRAQPANEPLEDGVVTDGAV